MLKKAILFLLVFCLPFQFGYHFWLPESFVKSFRIDYLSPTLYLTDILILIFFLTNTRKVIRQIIQFISHLPGQLFIILVLINLWSSSFNPVTLLAWLRLAAYLLLFSALRNTPNLIQQVSKPFLFSLTLVILIATLQFILQHSLGGPFYFLGERTLSTNLPNIAKLNIATLQILRPYSTFSHPNSLAGYLLVSFILLPFLTQSRFIKFLTALAILLTFSKAAILTLILINLFQFTFLQSAFTSVILSLLPLLKNVPFLSNWFALSFSSRHYLLIPSFQILLANWLTGVGLRQFIPSLANILPGNQLSHTNLQPVHNVFILIAIELGLVGLFVVAKILYTLAKQLLSDKIARRYLSKLTGAILLTGSLDHYWWTLPQNQLIIVLGLALIWNTHINKHALSTNHHQH